jgi:hypothetical protein
MYALGTGSTIESLHSRQCVHMIPRGALAMIELGATVAGYSIDAPERVPTGCTTAQAGGDAFRRSA